MNKFFLTVLATVTAAGIVANVSALWKINERLARVETRLEVLPKNPYEPLRSAQTAQR